MKVERLAVVALLLSGCGGQTTDVPAPTPSSMAPAPSPAPTSANTGNPATTTPAAPAKPAPASPTACTATNLLDRDSFDVTSYGIAGCVNDPHAARCSRVHTASEDSLTVADLDEGVGTLRFAYSTAADGSHGLLGVRWQDAKAGATVIEAAGIPAAVTLEAALTVLFSDDGSPKKAFACTFK